jgi:NAD(P)-dependent dehydrogenase (short-subunit alcohol dehydrogenase family)
MQGEGLMGQLHGKIALITGAGHGLGAALAQRFAQEGAHLILLGRRGEDLEKIDDQVSGYGVETTLVPVDLRQFDKLETLGISLAKKYDRLDIFIGNAAILGQLSPLPHQPAHLWQEVLDVNVTANFHLIRALDPLLKKSSHPRVIFVTSGVAQKHLSYWGAYSISKAALECLALTYAAENAQTSMRINVVDPGTLRTKLFHQAMPGIDLESVPLPESITEDFVYLSSPECQETGQIIHASPQL